MFTTPLFVMVTVQMPVSAIAKMDAALKTFDKMPAARAIIYLFIQKPLSTIASFVTR
jgi:hypothetical protein